MNEQTIKLIEQLAQKLGTTTEYLWSVLIKQAQISAMTELFYFVIVIIAGIGLYKFHKYCSKGKDNIYENEDKNIVVIPVIIVLSLIWIILFIGCFFSIDDVINGFFNPEYWALKQILRYCI